MFVMLLSLDSFNSMKAAMCSLKEASATLAPAEAHMVFTGRSSDNLQTSRSLDSPHLFINILVSLYAVIVKKLWAVGKTCCISLLTLVCVIHCQVFTVMLLNTVQLVRASLLSVCLKKACIWFLTKAMRFWGFGG